MNNRGVLVLALAVVCGLGSMLGVRRLLNSRRDDVPKQMVLVATAPIQIEETVTEEKVALKEMPADLVPAGALTDIKVARGRWAKVQLMAGDVLLDAKLAARGTPTGMLGKLRDGMRAITLRVDEQTGVSGFILPGYRVDILKAERDDGVNRARLLLKNVLVLAAGQVIDSPEGRSIQSTTVTVEVTPAQAELLTDAMSEGPLSLALRPMSKSDEQSMPEEPTPEELPPPAQLAGPLPPPPPPPLPAAAAEVAQPQPVLTRAEPGRRSRVTIFAGRGAASALHRNGVEEQEPAAAPGERRPFQMDGASRTDLLPEGGGR